MKVLKIITILFGLALNINIIKALESPQGIDTVYSITPGQGQNAGQSSEYFPMNIFGLPFANASEIVPASAPNDLCSIGFAGEIIVGFKHKIVVDGQGADFTIFENVMRNEITDIIFMEPAIISVSYDGISYLDFPFDTLTLEGCAGTKPTNGNENSFNPALSGGNSFDLATIGIQKIKYIKIKDFSIYLNNHPEHPHYDPTLSGFDLDALVGINLDTEGELEVISADIQKYSINNNTITSQYYTDYKVFSLNGELVSQSNLNGLIDLSYLKYGIYFIELSNKNNRIMVKYLSIE